MISDMHVIGIYDPSTLEGIIGRTMRDDSAYVDTPYLDIRESDIIQIDKRINDLA